MECDGINSEEIKELKSKIIKYYSDLNKKIAILRKLEENNIQPEQIKNIAGKNIYIFKLNKRVQKVGLLINSNDTNKINNSSCIIKYQFGDNLENNFELEKEKEIKVKKNNNNLELSFEKIPNNDNIKEIKYTAYLYDEIINIDFIYPELWTKKYNFINKKEIDIEKNNTNLDFNIKNEKDYSIVVLAKIVYKDESEEYLVYKTEFIKASKDDKRENDLIFFIIMGVFAFVIILVFIIVFRIINKRKANNPDIDDEEYNNLQALKETINEDEP